MPQQSVIFGISALAVVTLVAVIFAMHRAERMAEAKAAMAAEKLKPPTSTQDMKQSTAPPLPGGGGLSEAIEPETTPYKSSREVIAGTLFSVLFAITGVTVILAAIVGIYFALGEWQSCPKCHRKFARTFVETVEVSRVAGYGLVTRTSYSSGTAYAPGSNTQVNTSSSSSYQERVPVIRVTLHHHYKCNHCRHRWHKVAVEEFEDFSRK